MPIDNSFMIKRFNKFEYLYILFSRATKQPFIQCDEETFDDQIYVFTTEEMAKEFARPFAHDKYPLQIVKMAKNMVNTFLASLYRLSVNAVIIQDEGAPVRVELEKLAEKPDLEAMKNEPIPRANPELQLTLAYFMQELTRPVERTAAEKKELRDLEEEMAHNLIHARLIMAVDVTAVKGKWNPSKPNNKVRIPIVKNKEGKTFQPIFTEMEEFRKFNAANKNNRVRMQLAAVNYDSLEKVMAPDAEGIVFNPMGANLILKREQLSVLKNKYADA